MTRSGSILMTDGEIIEYISEHFDELHVQYLDLLRTSGKGAFVYLREPGTNKCDINKGRYLLAGQMNNFYNAPNVVRAESIDVALLKCDSSINIPVLFGAVDGPSDFVLVRKAETPT